MTSQTSPGTPPEKSKSGVLPAEAEQKLKQDAGAIVDEAKHAAGEIRTEARKQFGELAERGKAEFEHATDAARGFAEKQKDLVAGQLEGIANAVGRVADELETEDAPTAGYARTVADGMRRFTDDLQNRDVDAIVAMSQDFGRKHPGAFAAAAALAGFAASRFLVASSHRHGGRETNGARPASGNATTGAGTVNAGANNLGTSVGGSGGTIRPGAGSGGVS